MSDEEPEPTPTRPKGGDTGTGLVPTHMPDAFSHWFWKNTLALAIKTFAGLRIIGAENVPRTGPILFCPNHISDADPPALYASIPRGDVFYMGKQELFELPLAWFFRYHGGFPVKRNTADRAALRTGEWILKNGHCLVLFPEGGISQDGILRPMLAGAAMIAVNAGAPIVPMGITGTSAIIPYGKVMPRHGPKPVTIEFGKPIPAEEFADLAHKQKIVEATNRIETEIRRLTGQ